MTWRFVHVLMTLAFGTALGACFNPPSDAVLFACDAKTAPSCPDGYSCEADGCCHRDGSDIEADLGSCRIGGAMSGATGMDTGDTGTTGTNTTSTTASSDSSGGPSTSASAGSSDAGATSS